jgi:CRP-like cAMP-binding protein
MRQNEYKMNPLAAEVAGLPRAAATESTYYLHDISPVVQLDPCLPAIIRSVNTLLNSLLPIMAESQRNSMRTVSIEREQRLCEQDQRPEFVYFPETAVISELKLLEDGRVVEIALTGREGAVGVSSVFSTSPSSCCSEVAQDGTAVRIERDIMLKMARIHPEIASLLLPEVARHIKTISQRSVCNMYHDVRQRLSTWLLMLSDRVGAATLTLTHDQIARSLGVYRPSLTSIAVELRDDGSIEYSRGSFTVKDRARLQAQACICYAELSSIY